jgi:hypothetical protein
MNIFPILVFDSYQNEIMKIRELWKKHRVSLLGFAIGSLGGYLYWYYVGCLTGTCPLKKLWYYDALLGGLIGLLFADAIHSIIVKRKKQNKEYEND